MSCPDFGGPHLGLAADPSQVAAIPPAAADDDNKPSDDGEGVDDDDDDDDGAFGDFWRASARCAARPAPQCVFPAHAWREFMSCKGGRARFVCVPCRRGVVEIGLCYHSFALVELNVVEVASETLALLLEVERCTCASLGSAAAGQRQSCVSRRDGNNCRRTSVWSLCPSAWVSLRLDAIYSSGECESARAQITQNLPYRVEYEGHARNGTSPVPPTKPTNEPTLSRKQENRRPAGRWSWRGRQLARAQHAGATIH